MDRVIAFIVIALVMVGCSSQSAFDECADKQAYLWNRKVDDNRYKGNEAYWNAIAQCKDKYQ